MNQHSRRLRGLIATLVFVSILATGLVPIPARAAAAGHVWSWGDDLHEELGNGVGRADRNIPGAAIVDGVQLGGFQSVAAGYNHSLALKDDGTVWAWGADTNGQLGDGTFEGPEYDPVPTQVVGLADVKAIAAGFQHSVALKNDGTVWAWGDDYLGQLGTGEAGNPRARSFATPQRTVLLDHVVAIASSYYHSLALKDDGTVWVWGAYCAGFWNVAPYPYADCPTPRQVNGVGGVTAIAMSRYHVLALKDDGTVLSWGNNTHGQLGRATGVDSGNAQPPATVAGLGNIVAVAAGAEHSLALRSDGTVWVWGWGAQGQLGDGEAGNAHVVTAPNQVPGLGDIGMIVAASAGNHNFAVKRDGTLYAWGQRNHGQPGIGSTTTSALPNPTLVTGITNVTAIAASLSHSLAVANLTTTALTVTTAGEGGGTVARDPAGTGDGPFTFHSAQAVSLTARPAAGSVFTGWAVDGVPQGWANPLELTMATDHAGQATFMPALAFADVPAGRPDAGAIGALAARGLIRGYGDGTFGPDDPTLRAQMAALIARAMGYADSPANPFSDRCDPLVPANCVDGELWTRVAQLAGRDVARGYTDPATCAPAAAPCYAPRDAVLHAQVLSFITRAMVDAGYWQPQPTDPALFGGVLNGSGHEQDATTYVHYTQGVGGVPDYPAGGDFAAWDQASTRGWFARALWTALDSHLGVDRAP